MTYLKLALQVATLSSFTIVSQSATALEYFLKQNTWELIAIPAKLPSEANSPLAVFGDEILASEPLAIYGEDWVMFSYDSSINDYVELSENDQIEPDIGYWIIQAVASEITATLPNNSVLPSDSHADSLAAELGCSPGQILESAEAESWRCVDKVPVNCPETYVHYLLNAQDPASYGGEPFTSYIQEGDFFCSLEFYAEPEDTSDSKIFPTYQVVIANPELDPPESGDVSSWYVRVTMGSQERIFRSDPDNPPTEQEILACAELTGSCGEIRGIFPVQGEPR